MISCWDYHDVGHIFKTAGALIQQKQENERMNNYDAEGKRAQATERYALNYIYIT